MDQDEVVVAESSGAAGGPPILFATGSTDRHAAAEAQSEPNEGIRRSFFLSLFLASIFLKAEEGSI